MVKALAITGVPTTTKNIYDRAGGPSFFGSQTVVDELVDEIAMTWNLQRPLVSWTLR
jgi:hypothetical protein